MPLRDLRCKECGKEWDELVREQDRPTCPSCDSFNIEVLLALIGGYQGDTGGASTRPRQSTSFKAKRRA